MFLANFLNERLKKNLNEFNLNDKSINEKHFKKSHSNSFLSTMKKSQNENSFNSSNLQNLSKKDWEKTFTIKKLRSKWNKKINVNYEKNFNKYMNVFIPEKTKEKKNYIKNLVHSDILDFDNKRWNCSVNSNEKNKPELKKTIFEITNGLKSFNFTSLKENKIEEGIDSRDYDCYNDNNKKWNNSQLLLSSEKNSLSLLANEKAFENTIYYWRIHKKDRNNQKPIPISADRKYLESPRYYKYYRTPEKLYDFKYKTMQKVKDLTWLEREKVLKNLVHLYPRNYPEKINSLANKELKELYNEKFNELIGKKKNFIIENKKHWNDDEITEKIILINNWNNIDWFKPSKKDFDEKNETFSDFKKRKLLKALVDKSLLIMKEEDNIKNNDIELYKKELKKEMLKRKSNRQFNIKNNILNNSLKLSKYPIDKLTYENKKNNNEQNDLLNKNKSSINFFHKENNIIKINNEKDYNEKNFLRAYKNIVLNDMKHQKKKLSKDTSIEYKYEHFGKYREFIFNNKIYNNEINDEDEEIFKNFQEKFFAWSCCMNTNKNAIGCRKIKIDKKKWNYSSA